MSRRALNYALLLSITCLACELSGVFAECVSPNCRQSPTQGRPHTGDCNIYQPWFVNTGGWWALADEGSEIMLSESRQVKVTWCPSCDGLCPNKGNDEYQEVENVDSTYLTSCDPPYTMNAWSRCTNSPE